MRTRAETNHHRSTSNPQRDLHVLLAHLVSVSLGYRSLLTLEADPIIIDKDVLPRSPISARTSEKKRKRDATGNSLERHCKKRRQRLDEERKKLDRLERLVELLELELDEKRKEMRNLREVVENFEVEHDHFDLQLLQL